MAKPIQYCKVISLQLKFLKNKIKKEKGGDACIWMADSFCSIVETNTTL